MTDPLDGITDAHLQAALDKQDIAGDVAVSEVREFPSAYSGTIAHARTIAELAAMREKYEPAPDPVMEEAREIASKVLTVLGASSEQIAAGEIAAGKRDDAIVVHVACACLRRGIEMQQPFSREEALPIARAINKGDPNIPVEGSIAMFILTTPRDELAKMGEG